MQSVDIIDQKFYNIERSRKGEEDNIKTDLRKVTCEDGRWFTELVSCPLKELGINNIDTSSCTNKDLVQM
jgi:hypothetical protein